MTKDIETSGSLTIKSAVLKAEKEKKKMRTLTIEQFDTLKSARKTRISVTSTLDTFLNNTIKTLEKGKAYEIPVSEFAGKDVADVHYYAVLKALRKHDNLKYDIAMTSASRCNAIRVALK